MKNRGVVGSVTISIQFLLRLSRFHFIFGFKPIEFDRFIIGIMDLFP